MTRLASLLGLFLFVAGCSADPRDPSKDANLCEDVAAGPSPVALLRRDDGMFAAADPIILAGHLFFRTASIGGGDGGVFDLSLASLHVTDGPSGNISNLVGARDVLYWYDWDFGLFKNDGNGWSTWGIYGMTIDPVTTQVWYTKDGELHRFSDGSDWKMATGPFGSLVAAGAGGVYAVLNTDDGGEIDFMSRDGKTTRGIFAFSDGEAVSLKGDDRGAVALFADALFAIDASGDYRSLASVDGRKYEQLAIDATYAYFTEKTDFGRAIRRVPRDGAGAVETVTETRCTPQSLAVDGASLYWSTFEYHARGTNPGAIWALPTP